MAVMAMCVLLSCTEKKEEATLSGLMKSNFVSEVQGKPTALYVLKNQNGAEACVTNWGGRLVSVMVPDKDGKMTDVVLGYDNIQQYVDNPNNNYGGLIGRYGNRIANGKFSLDGVEYHLPQNNNGHCLHGGPDGYHTVVWDAKQVNDQSVELTYLSKDGEAGFPGNLNLKVTYTLTNDNAVDIKYEATTDKPTVVNLTNHSYFNLTGCKEPVLDHIYRINADSITPVDSTGIPTGEILAVAGTVYDYTTPQRAEKRIRKMGKGYDVNYKLNRYSDSLELAAIVVEPISGRVLKAYTTEPGMQFYIPNSNMDYLAGHDDKKYGRYYGFCLEMQHFPDAPNNPQFPTTSLFPGEIYRQMTIYKFETISE